MKNLKKKVRQELDRIGQGGPDVGERSVGNILGIVPKNDPDSFEVVEELEPGEYYVSFLGHLVKVTSITEEGIVRRNVFYPCESPERLEDPRTMLRYYKLSASQESDMIEAWQASRKMIAAEISPEREEAVDNKLKLLQAFEAGEVSLTEYAEEHNLTYAQVTYYRRSLTKKYPIEKVGKGVYTLKE